MTKSYIRGTGSYLPEKILTNDQLQIMVDTSDEWITTRTGIKTRHIAAEHQLTSDLAYLAAKQAIANAQLSVADIDLIIVATTTPDDTFPATAVKVQKLLAMHHGAAFDLQAVCSGFIYALTVADNFIRNQQAKNVLVIGSEVMSRIINWQDRASCILFGDGAGAIVLSACADDSISGIVANKIYSDGAYYDLLYTTGGVAKSQNAGTIVMQGKEVYKHAVEKMTASIMQLLSEHNLTIDDIDLLVPHQANLRILEAVASRLNINSDKVIKTVIEQANTSAATIPLALDYANNNQLLTRGDLLALTAIGGGLSWGASLIRW